MSAGWVVLMFIPDRRATDMVRHPCSELTVHGLQHLFAPPDKELAWENITVLVYLVRLFSFFPLTTQTIAFIWHWRYNLWF